MSIHALQVVTAERKEAQHDGLLHLARNLNIHPDVLIGDGNEIVGTGMPGSGKTTLMALLLEQFGACGLPFSAFDLEGDLKSVVDLLPRGVLGTIDNCPTAQDMYEGGLQVVFDLASWGEDSSHAARFINRTIRDLLSLMRSLPHNDRVPFLVGLDEAAYWLPQTRKDKNYLESSQFEALFSVFHTLAIRGRKMGLVPMLFTQRFASVHKDVLSPGTYILMRQTTDTDLKRYMEYISSAAFGEDEDELTEKEMRHRIASFKKGQAVIKLPSGKQGLVQFNNRQSLHISHAPKTQAAINIYREVSFDPERHYGSFQEDEERITTPVATLRTVPNTSQDVKSQVFALLDTDPNLSQGALVAAIGCSLSSVRRYRDEYFTRHPERQKETRQGKKSSPTLKEWVFSLMEANPALTPKDLAIKTGRPTDTVQKYRLEYFAHRPEKMPPKPPPKTETAVRAQLAENPNYTVSQISYRTGYCKRDVNKILARIRGEVAEGRQS